MATKVKEFKAVVGACYVYVDNEHFLNMYRGDFHTSKTFVAYGGACLKPRHDREEYRNFSFTIGRNYLTAEAAMQAANEWFGKELKFQTHRDGSFVAYPKGVLGLLTKKQKEIADNLRKKNEAYKKQKELLKMKR
jgi:hypothetical protein